MLKYKCTKYTDKKDKKEKKRKNDKIFFLVCTTTTVMVHKYMSFGLDKS